MATRSLNKAMLIGNLTRDPELRYTPQGTAVCNFGMATNRYWVTDKGEKKEETEFHRIVAWNKLAELCGQLLAKGRKVYVEGRLQTRSWTAADGAQRSTTEVVISDMVILDSKRAFEAAKKEMREVSEEEIDISDEGTLSEKKTSKGEGGGALSKKKTNQKKKSSPDEKAKEGKEEEKVSPDEIPF